MRRSTTETLEVSPAQETTGGKDLARDDLLALLALFLLLDKWDRKRRGCDLTNVRLAGFGTDSFVANKR